MTVLVVTQNGDSAVLGGGPLVLRTLPAAPDSPPTAVTVTNITDNQGQNTQLLATETSLLLLVTKNTSYIF